MCHTPYAKACALRLRLTSSMSHLCSDPISQLNKECSKVFFSYNCRVWKEWLKKCRISASREDWMVNKFLWKFGLITWQISDRLMRHGVIIAKMRKFIYFTCLFFAFRCFLHAKIIFMSIFYIVNISLIYYSVHVIVKLYWK